MGSSCALGNQVFHSSTFFPGNAAQEEDKNAVEKIIRDNTKIEIERLSFMIY